MNALYYGDNLHVLRKQFKAESVDLIYLRRKYVGNNKPSMAGLFSRNKFFRDIDQREARKIVVSVKDGGLKADDARPPSHARTGESGNRYFYFAGRTNARNGEERVLCGTLHQPERQEISRVQLLTIDGLLSHKQRAEHPDYPPDLKFKNTKTEASRQLRKLCI